MDQDKDERGSRVEGAEAAMRFEGKYADLLVEFDSLLEAMEGEVISADPTTMGAEDVRGFEEMSAAEVESMIALVCARYGVDLSDPSYVHREYVTAAPDEATVPGPIRVQVYLGESGQYVHLLTYADGSKACMVGADSDI
ncbi:MAG: hypothetical protein UZ21_OP11001000051 [Microgenomates bacterium OLB22]|nr:MAG: hypothetical protein UZ21_OP11001000051 [Microgenomates bacterium OLB22]